MRGLKKPRLEGKRAFVDKKAEVKKRPTEWSAISRKYRCMRCGRRSPDMRITGRLWKSQMDVAEVRAESKEGRQKYALGRSWFGSKS